MGLIKNFFAKSRDKPNNSNIPTGRMTTATNYYTSNLSPYRSRTGDVLKTLRSIPDETTAVEYLRKVNPDVSMAVWNFIRLANQGHEMHFYSLDGKTRLTNLDDEWRNFASRVNEISNSGLDGIIDQIHYSAYVLGAMGIEVEVTPDRKDIYDVHVIKPQTIEWELKEIKGRKKWVPYQYNGTKKIYLDEENANFFWVPTDTDIGDPRGNLSLSPVLQSIDFQLQILQDLQAVLHHQGYPKNDVSIDIDKLMSIMPPNFRNDPVKQRKWLQDEINEVRRNLENMEPDSDYVHTSDTSVNMNQGANAGRSLDVRAITEMVDTQVLNGLKQLGSFANRTSGKTETWSTVEYLIMTQGIKSCQRGSKRIIEEISRLWLRVKGIQAIPVFTHNEVNYQSENDRLTNKKIKQSIYAIAQAMGWINPDVGAQEVMGEEKAYIHVPPEQIRVSFSNIGGVDGVENNKHSGNERQPNNTE